MNIELIKNILIVAVGASVISTATIQKIKEQLKNKKALFIVSLIISIVIGTLFSLSFTELSLINSIWVGLVTWIGADALYKTFEDKIFTKFSDINNSYYVEIERE